MNGEERRKEILQMIKGNTVPISGTELSKKLGVSRQIIVQDRERVKLYYRFRRQSIRCFCKS